MLGSVGFGLVTILTAVLYLRPAELVVSLAGWPLYEVTILCCLLVLFPVVVDQFRPSQLKARPITACVVGLMLAVPLSLISQFQFGGAAEAGYDFFKIVLSYLLILAAINTPARLRLYLFWTLALLLIHASLGLMQYHGVIANPALAPHMEWAFDEETGALARFPRLSGVGIFGNPNDLARFLVVGIGIGLYFLASARSNISRILWLAPLGVLGYALALTYSRGGLMALAAMLLVLACQLLGRGKGLVLGTVSILAMLVVFAGRQTEFSTSEGTGQQRIRLWSDGFDALRSSPLFGIGAGHYPEVAGGLVAHNSFVHSYVELGLFGGTLFTGTFFLGLWLPQRVARVGRTLNNKQLDQVRPYLVAILAGYVVGMLSSSRCYAIPTYLLLGLISVYLRLASQRVPAMSFRVPRIAFRVCMVSVLTLIALQGIIWSSVQWNAK